MVSGGCAQANLATGGSSAHACITYRLRPEIYGLRLLGDGSFNIRPPKLDWPNITKCERPILWQNGRTRANARFWARFSTVIPKGVLRQG